MKKFRKLVPALCMLLVSAVLMGTSTYAWFSMNTTVTASGMEITAKSESKFLQIVAGTDAFSDSVAQISTTAKNTTKAVRPVAAVKDANGTTLTQADKATDIKWVEAFSNDPTSSNKVGNYTDVTSLATVTGDTNIYTLINDFKVRLNPTTGAQTANNLTVQSVTIASNTEAAKDDMKAAVRVLFVCGDEWVIWSANGKVAGSDEDGSVIAASIGTTETSLKVYIFFDGEDTVTTTNNATLIGTNGYTVEFALHID